MTAFDRMVGNADIPYAKHADKLRQICTSISAAKDLSASSIPDNANRLIGRVTFAPTTSPDGIVTLTQSGHDAAISQRAYAAAADASHSAKTSVLSFLSSGLLIR